ncbi:hypothetical protein NDU88_003576 [Pleurodeles waltl]|uniref:Uncharacterized protein n=1 Tax=Pleurodeles waltl TaxID=8319 RepID=A0AAV7NL24_PLEWA|nr:hypothetical protein NDU88_003576 [Pleurodeles waltl]
MQDAARRRFQSGLLGTKQLINKVLILPLQQSPSPVENSRKNIESYNFLEILPQAVKKCACWTCGFFVGVSHTLVANFVKKKTLRHSCELQAFIRNVKTTPITGHPKLVFLLTVFLLNLPSNSRCLAMLEPSVNTHCVRASQHRPRVG